ncbi:protein PAL OF QUIRKY-like [Amaranthus tricolor]|uniref:protein PAL OF QUIRKY-like n=1 Tax=Amaranthus tricolor TaxID=29722 RepID=UPI0025871DB3|nr:protein PAL OF QUIRKY-like [Amaranthus tricolor]
MVECLLKSSNNNIKFLCSYGGKIVPRYPDGKLRYHGGHTRVLAVNRSISFSELMVKMEELCGVLVSLRCQLPNEDLDALISIKSDEDLANLIEEYDRFASSSSTKVRAFLLPLNSSNTTTSISPPASLKSLSPKTLSPSSSFSAAGSSPRFVQPVLAYPVGYAKSARKNCQNCCRNSNQIFLIHNGNHWQ